MEWRKILHEKLKKMYKEEYTFVWGNKIAESLLMDFITEKSKESVLKELNEVIQELSLYQDLLEDIVNGISSEKRDFKRFTTEENIKQLEMIEKNVKNNIELHREIMELIKTKIELKDFIGATVWEMLGQSGKHMSLDDDNFTDEDLKAMEQYGLKHLGNFFLMADEIVADEEYVRKSIKFNPNKEWVKERFDKFIALFQQIQEILNKAEKENPYLYTYVLKYKDKDLIYIGYFLSNTEMPNMDWLRNNKRLERILFC